MNKKTAFTLIELLIVMAIIGIVTTIGVNIFKKHTMDSRYLYSNVYHSLDQAVYNAMNYSNLGNPFKNKDEKTRADISEGEQVRRLCLMLTNYINSRSSCSAENIMPVSATNENFSAATPQFTALNGVRFYISKMLPENYDPNHNNLNPDADAQDHAFFIVFADLNGAVRPNSMHYVRGSINPDIFAFAVLDIGRVCPLGPPEIDEKFMLTRISYHNFGAANANEDFTNLAFSEPSKPYFITKAEAWGYYLQGDYVIDENPYTYNDYVRRNIGNSMIYDGMRTYAAELADYQQNVEQVTLRSSENDANGRPIIDAANRRYGCINQLDDNCNLIIDKYLY